MEKGQTNSGSFKKGKPPWNKGLTKETDRRLDYERPTTFKKGYIPYFKFNEVSKETKEKMRSGKIGKRGELTNNWKDGITPKVTLLRASAKYQIWRNLVFLRDNFTCQKCGETKKFLNAHHKIHVSKDISKIFNVNNGITLCVDCHQLEHPELNLLLKQKE